MIGGFKIFFLSTRDNATIVPTRKESRMAHSISDLRLSIEKEVPRIAPLPGRGRPVFGMEFGVRGQCPRFESGDMSPHSKNPVIAGVAVTLPRLFRQAGSSAPMTLRALLQFAGSMVDQFPSRQASS